MHNHNIIGRVLIKLPDELIVDYSSLHARTACATINQSAHVPPEKIQRSVCENQSTHSLRKRERERERVTKPEHPPEQSEQLPKQLEQLREELEQLAHQPKQLLEHPEQLPDKLELQSMMIA